MKYSLSRENFEISNIIISSKPCYTRKELKFLQICSEKDFETIENWLAEQEEKSPKEKNATFGGYLHDKDLFLEFDG
jgi:hypothetical protein